MKSFFDKGKRESVDSYIDLKNDHLLFNIQGPIVDTIIGDMFFHPEDDEQDDDAVKKHMRSLYICEPRKN